MSESASGNFTKEAFKQFADRDNPERFVILAEKVLGLRLAETQKRILRAVAQNKYVLIQSGNGVGKSYVVAALNLAFLLARMEAIVFCTSGTYNTLEDTIWRPMESMHKRLELPGTPKRSPPRIEDLPNPDSFFRAIAPKHPSNLEGRHGANMLVIVEEADKPDVTKDHITSAESSITDVHDRMVVICNPPDDESNIVHQLAQPESKYKFVQFSSFESHNALIDAGKIEGEKIPGLVELSKIKEDWESYNHEDWPGFETARYAHEERDDLDARWYKKRAGVIPPANAAIRRPIYHHHVKAACDRYDALSDEEKAAITPIRQGIGVDIGHEGGDLTAILQIRGKLLEQWAVEQYQSPSENEALIANAIESGDLLGICAMDAIGEGSGPAHGISRQYRAGFRFKANEVPADDAEYADKKTEAYTLLGKFLRDGGMVPPGEIRDELYAASRSMEYDKRTRGGDTVLVTSKDPVKERLERSPDRLDAASMTVWAATIENPHSVGGDSAGIYDIDPW